MSLISLGYLLVAVFGMRPVAGHLAWKAAKAYSQSKPDVGDWFAATLMALVICVLWAPLLIAFGITRASTAIFPPVGEEKAALERAKAAKTKELEKELGL